MHPARLAWPDATTNASSVNSDVEHLRLTTRAKAIEQLKYLTRLKSLWCFDINERTLDQICDCVSLENLYIDGLKAGDLSCMGRLGSLSFLRLERCSKVDSPDDIGRLHNLVGLGIEGFKNVHNIEPVSNLTKLRELGITGTIWTRMTIESLKPIAGLRHLNYMDLTNLKVKDESLKPLSGLNQLHTLHIANFYPMEEFAC